MKLNVIYKQGHITKLKSYIDTENPNCMDEIQKKGREVGATLAWVGDKQVIGIIYGDKHSKGLTARGLECDRK